MKLLIPLFTLLLVSVSANASHFVTCDVTAEVVNIQNLDLMNDTTVTRRSFSPAEGSTVDETITIATIEITSVSNNEGMLKCQFKNGDEITLAVKKEEKGEYSEGQKLELNYRNVGDALGSGTTWKLK